MILSFCSSNNIYIFFANCTPKFEIPSHDTLQHRRHYFDLSAVFQRLNFHMHDISNTKGGVFQPGYFAA